MYHPQGIAVDSSGIYVADEMNNRVLYYSGTSTTATRVYGQAGSFTSNTANNGGISANSLYQPTGVAVDSSGVYIADKMNNRVLYYSGTSTTATRVYGQAGSFASNTANNGGISADSLNNPFSVAIYSGGIYIADSENSRVLYYSGTSSTATRVYGQLGSLDSASINNGGISADSLYCPAGVAIDSEGLYITDNNNNHRLLFYSGTSTTATKVYGQLGSFTTKTSNNSGISADSLYFPVGVVVDSGRVYIADTYNNRVLKY